MLEQIIALLLALAVAGGGLATAVEHVAPAPQSVDAVGPELADEMAALGLARAAEARATRGDGDDASLLAVDGLTQATEALTQAMDNAPEAADDGLERAWDAVNAALADDAPAVPTNAGAPEGVPPTIDAPPVAAPPVDQTPPETTPPVETPAGPPSGVPDARP